MRITSSQVRIPMWVCRSTFIVFMLILLFPGKALAASCQGTASDFQSAVKVLQKDPVGHGIKGAGTVLSIVIPEPDLSDLATSYDVIAFSGTESDTGIRITVLKNGQVEYEKNHWSGFNENFGSFAVGDEIQVFIGTHTTRGQKPFIQHDARVSVISRLDNLGGYIKCTHTAIIGVEDHGGDNDFNDAFIRISLITISG